ncbi:MAG: integrase core domain-containing protein [Gammaproteobacteria bacterium]
MARENLSWGFDRIQSELANPGHVIAPNTVKNILKRYGIEPAPERGKRTSWKTFLKAHLDVMAATDFFTVEVWMPRGLVTYYVLFIIHLSTRSVHIAGVTMAPNSAFMAQVVRNLTDVSEGFLSNSRYLIMDLDTKYTEDFRGHLDRVGVKPVRCPARAPNCNAFAERFARSIKDECLGRMILFGASSLRRALREYAAHYHAERNHQGVGNRLLESLATVSSINDPMLNQ